MKCRLTYLCCFLFFIFEIKAQHSVQETEIVVDEILSTMIDHADGTVDYTDLRDQLEYYSKNKINLNKTEREELQKLFFIDEITINAIIQHRNDFGKFISVYELQSIDAIDERTLYYLSYFVSVEESLFADRTPFLKMFSIGKHEIIALHENEFQQRSGYDKSREAAGKEYFLGSPYRYVLRYEYTFKNCLTFGYAGEKDMGEQFFQGAQKYGFDFNSFHFLLRDFGKFKIIAIGDYQANFGQGLTFGSGMTGRKSAYVLAPRRNFENIRAYRSLNENEFLRGSAVTYKYGNLEFTGIFSYKYISTNYRSSDTITSSEDYFSSVQLTGLHRTQSEIQDMNNVLQGIYGGHIKYCSDNYDFGITAVNTFYNNVFLPGTKPYQLYNFRGKQLSDIGFDFNFYLQNTNFFGEVSHSPNGAFAGISGLIFPVHNRLDLLFIYRNYAKDFQTTFNNPFGENADGKNEEGFYSGMVFKINQHWNINSYFDFYRSPWLRYMIDGPSQGHEFFSELQYIVSGKTIFYFRYRHETKMHNVTDVISGDVFVAGVDKDVFLLHASHIVNSTISAETRFEYVKYSDRINPDRFGSLISEDIKMKITKRSAFACRIALFNVDDYKARVYGSEPDVLYQYSMPQYINNGVRYSFLLHYQFNKIIDCWIKYSQTTYSNVTATGSGLMLINGNTVSDLRVQLRFILK